MSRREQDFTELARTLDQHERDRAVLESDPAWSTRDPAEVAALVEGERLRAQAAGSLGFAQARQCLDAGYWLVAVDTDGRLDPEFPATRDIAAAAAWWSAHPDSTAAMATGPDYGLYALDVGHPRGGGPAWIHQACYEPPDPDAYIDPEDPQFRPPGWPRDPCSAPVNLSAPEPSPPGPRLRGTPVVIGSAAIRKATERLLRPLAPPVRQLLVWEYPRGWRLPKPGSRISAEITVLGYVPLAESRIKLGDRSWRVETTLGRVMEMPPYLAEVLAGKRVPGPLPPQLQRQRVEMA